MKQLFIKHAEWCYGLSAVLWIGAVVLSICGWQDDLGQWMGIAGISFAVGVADATGKLIPLKKNKN